MAKVKYRGRQYTARIDFGSEIVDRGFFGKSKTDVKKQFSKTYVKGKLLSITGGTKFFR